MALAPTAPGERLESVDVLRGLALFGVLLENLQHFVSPSYAAIVAAPEAGWLDHGGLWLIRFFCDNKVYLLFSLLFGYGIALQMLRSQASRAHFVPLQLWRMGTLFLIGVAHAMVWSGDILSTYAVLGVLLLPLRRSSDRTLAIVCALGLAAPTLAVAALATFAPGGAEARASLQGSLAALIYPWRQASFAFGMFALGLRAGRTGALTDPSAFTARARRYLAPALALGVAANLASLILLERVGAGRLSAEGALLEASVALGSPALAFCYVYAAAWGLTRPRLRARLLPLIAVGRTTLSNYLLQSLVGIGILAHTGLGPWGHVTPVSGIALSCAIFAAQVAASRWWLARFRFGPVEWLWRSVSYGTLQPLRAETPRSRSGARAS